MTEYVDSNGNFTHTKIEGSQEQRDEFIKMVIKHFQEEGFTKEEMIPIHLELINFRKTGCIASAILIELVMPSFKKSVEYSERYSYSEIYSEKEHNIIFKLPCNYKENP